MSGGVIGFVDLHGFLIFIVGTDLSSNKMIR